MKLQTKKIFESYTNIIKEEEYSKGSIMTVVSDFEAKEQHDAIHTIKKDEKLEISDTFKDNIMFFRLTDNDPNEYYVKKNIFIKSVKES